jgi:hypothetical protein
MVRSPPSVMEERTEVLLVPTLLPDQRAYYGY